MATAFDRMRRYSRGNSVLLSDIARRLPAERDFAASTRPPSEVSLGSSKQTRAGHFVPNPEAGAQPVPSCTGV
jgi:hypothetical protein